MIKTMKKVLILILVVLSTSCSPIKQLTDSKTGKTREVHFKRHTPQLYKIAAFTGFIVGLTIVGPLLYENVPAVRNIVRNNK